MTKFGTVGVLFMAILPVVAGCGGEESFPAGGGPPAGGEGEGAHAEGEGEGPVAGEGEGSSEGEGTPSEGEGEDPVCDPAACADAFECTDDRCADNRCVNVPTHARCGEGKICKPDAGGCVAAPACRDETDCVSEDPCTVGICEPATRACSFLPLDGDFDQHQPRVCGGDDCDDGNPFIYPGVDESCDGVDDNCNGDVDEGINVREDPANCGSCGNRCSAFLVCRESQCQCEQEGFSPCDGYCANLQTDRENCGICDSWCEFLVCRDGDCQCPNEGELPCEDEFGGVTCTNVQSDYQNCGACGNECTGGQHCVNGACACGQGEQLCGWDDEFGNYSESCVDTLTSFSDCGGCGHACSAGLNENMFQVCRDGQCVCPQEWRSDICPNVGCVDFATDYRNCGACGNNCDGTICLDGRCTACNEDPRLAICDVREGCISLENNRVNCGACGNVCPAEAPCREGRCQCDDNRLTPCDFVGCIDLQNDQLNCGACGNSCLGGVCRMGQCGCVEENLTYCDEHGGGCVDLRHDRWFGCGQCGHACNPNEICLDGACSACPGQTPCEIGGWRDGRQVPVHLCVSDFCASEECIEIDENGGCITWGDTEKCTDFSRDIYNCGECLHECLSGEDCTDGICRCPPERLCNGLCTNPMDDHDHCGECNHVCDQNDWCTDGQCGQQ